jgi:hypothetical protein
MSKVLTAVAAVPGVGNESSVVAQIIERIDALGAVGVRYRDEAQTLFLQAAQIADTYGQCSPFSRLVAKLGPHEVKVAVQYVTKYTPVRFRADGTAYMTRGERVWDHDGMASVRWYAKHVTNTAKLRGVDELLARVRTVAKSDDPGAWTDEAVELAGKFIELAVKEGYLS